MSPRLVLGVDGGGTSTRLAIVAEDGAVLGEGAGGSGNLHDVGPDAVADSLRAAQTEAWRAAGRSPEPAAAAFLGLASVLAARDRALALDVAKALDLRPDAPVAVDFDLRIALAGAHEGAPGVVLIAGTGSSCYGRDARGRSWRAGGWGSLLDDLGSSTWLGTQALVAAVRAIDGRGEPTALGERALAALGVAHPDDILLCVDGLGLSRRQRAALAPLVTSAAAEGDAVAREILARGGDELARMVASVVRALGGAPLPVAVTGGLLAAGDEFLGPLRAALARRAPRCPLVEARLAPVLGAALLALESLGVEVSPRHLANLRAGSER